MAVCSMRPRKLHEAVDRAPHGSIRRKIDWHRFILRNDPSPAVSHSSAM